MPFLTNLFAYVWPSRFCVRSVWDGSRYEYGLEDGFVYIALKQVRPCDVKDSFWRLSTVCVISTDLHSTPIYIVFVPGLSRRIIDGSNAILSQYDDCNVVINEVPPLAAGKVVLVLPEATGSAVSRSSIKVDDSVRGKRVVLGEYSIGRNISCSWIDPLSCKGVCKVLWYGGLDKMFVYLVLPLEGYEPCDQVLYSSSAASVGLIRSKDISRPNVVVMLPKWHYNVEHNFKNTLGEGLNVDKEDYDLLSDWADEVSDCGRVVALPSYTSGKN